MASEEHSLAEFAAAGAGAGTLAALWRACRRPGTARAFWGTLTVGLAVGGLIGVGLCFWATHATLVTVAAAAMASSFLATLGMECYTRSARPPCPDAPEVRHVRRDSASAARRGAAVAVAVPPFGVSVGAGDPVVVQRMHERRTACPD